MASKARPKKVSTADPGYELGTRLGEKLGDMEVAFKRGCRRFLSRIFPFVAPPPSLSYPPADSYPPEERGAPGGFIVPGTMIEWCPLTQERETGPWQRRWKEILGVLRRIARPKADH